MFELQGVRQFVRNRQALRTCKFVQGTWRDIMRHPVEDIVNLSETVLKKAKATCRDVAKSVDAIDPTRDEMMAGTLSAAASWDSKKSLTQIAYYKGDKPLWTRYINGP